MDPLAEGGEGWRLSVAEEAEAIGDALGAEALDADPDEQIVGEAGLVQKPARGLRDDAAGRLIQRGDAGRLGQPTVDGAVEERLIRGIVEMTEHVIVRPARGGRPDHGEVLDPPFLLTRHRVQPKIEIVWREIATGEPSSVKIRACVCP